MIAEANAMRRAPESRRESSDVMSFVSPHCLPGGGSRMPDRKPQAHWTMTSIETAKSACNRVIAEIRSTLARIDAYRGTSRRTRPRAERHAHAYFTAPSDDRVGDQA